MKDMNRYRGIIPAFYACYDRNGNISPSAVRKLARYMADKGVKGLYVGGSSGECIYQSVEERKIVLDNVMAEVGGSLTVIAHVACNNTKDSAELARHAESLGADAIAAIPPIYFHLPDRAIAHYWNTISDAAPDTDFVIYNIPQLAGVSLTMPLFEEMLKNPRLAAVKNSSVAVQDIQMFKERGTRDGREFVVFNGPDEQLAGGLAMGADGGIGGTYGVMPELYLRLFELSENGENAKAVLLQNDINAIILKLCSMKGHMYAVIKEVLRRREGIDIGGVREPLYNLTDDDTALTDECARMIGVALDKWNL